MGYKVEFQLKRKDREGNEEGGRKELKKEGRPTKAGDKLRAKCIS